MGLGHHRHRRLPRESHARVPSFGEVGRVVFVEDKPVTEAQQDGIDQLLSFLIEHEGELVDLDVVLVNSPKAEGADNPLHDYLPEDVVAFFAGGRYTVEDCELVACPENDVVTDGQRGIVLFDGKNFVGAVLAVRRNEGFRDFVGLADKPPRLRGCFFNSGRVPMKGIDTVVFPFLLSPRPGEC